MKGQRARAKGNQRLSKRAPNFNERQKWGQVRSEPNWEEGGSQSDDISRLWAKNILSASLSQSAQKCRKSHCACGDFLGVDQKKQASSHQWQTKTKIVGSYLWSVLTICEHSSSPQHFFKPNICFLYICRHVGKKKVKPETRTRSAEFQKAV